jgi:hypothetical protein
LAILRGFYYAQDNLGIKKTLGPIENNKCLIKYALPANKKIMSNNAN